MFLDLAGLEINSIQLCYFLFFSRKNLRYSFFFFACLFVVWILKNVDWNYNLWEVGVQSFGFGLLSKTILRLKIYNSPWISYASILTDTAAVIAILHFDIIATAIISIVVTEGIIIYIITKAIGYPFCMTSSLH